MSSELPDLDEAISFAVDNGAQAGPFSMRSIVDSVKQGQRLPSTLVWWAGEPDWVPFNSVPGLVALTQDPVETLPPPPADEPMLGGAAPAGAADATMTFGAVAAADPVAAEPMAAEPIAADPVPEAEPVVDVFEPQVNVDAGFADSGAPGDVIEMGGEIDATQAWSAPDAVEPEANMVESEGADFSWATPEPGATDDVWADVNQGATEVPAAEPESTDGGGLSTGLFGAGAGAVAAAGAAAGGIFASGSDAVEDAVPDGVDLSGVAEAVPDAGDLGGAVADAMPDGSDLATNVGEAMPDAVSPLQSVNDRIEALGADSPVAEAAPAAEAVEEMAAAEPVAAVAAEPVVDAGSEEAAVAMEESAPVEVEEPAVVEEPVVADPAAAAFVAADPVAEVEAGAAGDGRSDLFSQLLDRSAAVEASEMRADRKIVVMLAGFMNVAAHRSLAVLDMVATGLQHSVRFENPSDGTRTTVALGNAGDHVRMAFGFGTPVADPESVLTSTAWDDGPIMIGADTDDGLAFTGVDLFIDPSDYVTATNTVDAEALGAMFDALTHELRSSLLFGLED